MTGPRSTAMQLQELSSTTAACLPFLHRLTEARFISPRDWLFLSAGYFDLNDGPSFNGYATPGTKLYDSGLFAIPAPIDRGTIHFTEGLAFPVGGLFLGPGPGGSLLSNLTWSVQFSGMGPTDEIGLDIYSTPVVGGNYADFWENNGGWSLQTNLVPMNFAAKLEAVPEPSPLVLCLLSAIGFLAERRQSTS